MELVYGTFILNNTNNGYHGEFFNNHSTQFVEENIRIVAIQNPFQGTFQTEWEEKGQKYSADLTITLNGSVYNLNWNNVRKGTELQSVTFEGRGVIEQGRLVAVYQMR